MIMIKSCLLEIGIGFFLAAAVVIAKYATTSAVSTFVYQGF